LLREAGVSPLYSACDGAGRERGWGGQNSRVHEHEKVDLGETTVRKSQGGMGGGEGRGCAIRSPSLTPHGLPCPGRLRRDARHPPPTERTVAPPGCSELFSADQGGGHGKRGGGGGSKEGATREDSPDPATTIKRKRQCLGQLPPLLPPPLSPRCPNSRPHGGKDHIRIHSLRHPLCAARARARTKPPTGPSSLSPMAGQQARRRLVAMCRSALHMAASTRAKVMVYSVLGEATGVGWSGPGR